MGIKSKCKLVGYRRVSTREQGDSRLGLEAQDKAIRDYQTQTGCTLVAVYTEVESGKRSDRPELSRAIAYAKRAGAVLVVAKLDRLARNTRFLLGLVESGVDLAFCDFPQIPPGALGRKMLTDLASMAEFEAGIISERTKAALAALKARGVKLGGYRANAAAKLTPEVRARAAKNAGKAHRAEAVDAYADLLPVMLDAKSAGLSLSQIAARLNEAGHQTRTGAEWSKVQVKRVLDRGA